MIGNEASLDLVSFRPATFSELSAFFVSLNVNINKFTLDHNQIACQFIITLQYVGCDLGCMQAYARQFSPQNPWDDHKMTEKSLVEIQEIDDILSELGSDFKVRIERLEPRWCDGSLGTLHISSGERLDLEELGERYGGRKLLLRFIGPNGRVIKAKTVKFPGPPREDGIIIKQRLDPADEVHSSSRPDEQNTFGSMEAILNMMNNQSAAHQKTIETIMLGRISNLESQIEERQQTNPALAPPATSGLDQIRESMSMIAEISKLQKDILPQAENEGGGNNKSPFEGVIQDFVKMMMEREKLKMEMAVKQQTAQTTAPPLDQPAAVVVPPAPAPTPAPASDPSDLESVPNDIFAAEVKRRFDQLGDDDKLDLMRVVAGDSIDFEEEEEFSPIIDPHAEDLRSSSPIDFTSSDNAADVSLNSGGPPEKDDQNVDEIDHSPASLADQQDPISVDSNATTSNDQAHRPGDQERI